MTRLQSSFGIFAISFLLFTAAGLLLAKGCHAGTVYLDAVNDGAVGSGYGTIVSKVSNKGE